MKQSDLIPEKLEAIVVDLDGTLYNCDERRKKYLDIPSKDFEGFNAAAIHDEPHVWCAELVQAMKDAAFEIIFVSGREDAWRADTEKWLKKNLNLHPNGFHYHLYMRPTGDRRPDHEVKTGIFHQFIDPRFRVLFCVDDRSSVVRSWRALGLTVLHCAEGDF